MSNSYRLRQLAFGLLIALFAFSLSSSASAQTSGFKRKVILDEFTGTWCQYCPIGAWVMDSVQHRMEDWVVQFAWHVGDPMQIPANVQFEKEMVPPGYPTLYQNRYYQIPNYNWSVNTPAYALSVADAKKEPEIDLRITNVTIVGTKMDFDVEITPLNLKTMAKEDTCKYGLFVAVTEDGVKADQTYANPESGQVEQILDFVHQNVVRAVKTKTQGDDFPMGTTTPVATYPIKKHFSVTSINGEWVQENLRLKAFVMRKPKSSPNFVLNADQTDHVGTLPETAPNAVWTVTPTADAELEGNKPATIVWSKQGATTKVKLEYSIDGGAKWSSIATDVATSPYTWTMPAEVMGQNVVIRITDATTASITSTSEQFSVIAPIPVTAEVIQPTAGEKLRPSAKYMIQWTTGGEFGPSAKLEYTTDNGAKWSSITTVTNGSTSFNWTVPNVDAPEVQVRVSNVDGTTTGLSGTFSIAPLGTINTIVVNNGNAVPRNAPVDVTWTTTGDVGTSVKLEWSNGGNQWSTLQNNIPVGTTSYSWTTPDQHVAKAYLRLTSNENVIRQSAEFEIGTAGGASVKLNGVPTSNGIASSYPNPFASTSSIVYHIAKAGDVTLKVSDILGKDVLTLESGAHQVGVYSTELNASELAPGTYVVTLLVNGESYSRTVSVTK